MVGIAGGLGVGFANYVAEAVAMVVCIWLEQQGIIQRFIPGTVPFAEHPPSNILAVGLPYIPLYYAISQNWAKFAQSAVLDFNVLRVWSFIVMAMLCHDAWFFSLHTLFHKVRRLYKHVHSLHHCLGASCSALGNAYADAIDIGLCFVGFHAALFVYLYCQPTWNPAAVVALIVVEVMTNIVGELLSCCIHLLHDQACLRLKSQVAHLDLLTTTVVVGSSHENSHCCLELCDECGSCSQHIQPGHDEQSNCLKASVSELRSAGNYDVH